MLGTERFTTSSSELGQNILDQEVHDAEKNDKVSCILDECGRHSAGIRSLLDMALFNLNVALIGCHANHPLFLC